jgi:F0F1-type ATP synthase epsilon subunit
VHGGFLQVDTSPGAAEGLAEGDGPLPGLSTRVTVLAGVAELAEEIDVPRAERAKEAAAQRVAELSSGRGAGRRSAAGGRSGRRPGRGAA